MFKLSKMKNTFQLIPVMVLVIVLLVAFIPKIKPVLEIGETVPSLNHKMMDVSSDLVSLSDVKDENGLLVIFSCNTCPYVKLSETRIKSLAALAKNNKIGVVVINSNTARRDSLDSFDAMKKYAVAQAYDFRYLLDDNATIANAFGAKRTPQCFLFDSNVLVYRGAIDDNIKNEKKAKNHYLQDAITAVAKNEEVKVKTSKSIGCTIKRNEGCNE